jgi:HAD superfamily hydrolase (TIGR01509 family)
MHRVRIPHDALVLDLDGTLANTEPFHVRAWDAALDGYLNEEVRKTRVGLTGLATAKIASEMVRIFGLPMDSGDLERRKRRIYHEMVSRELEPFPGLAEELAPWRAGPLALATASTRVTTTVVLERLGFTDWFNPVITLDDVERPKPAPECYERAARQLGIPSARCIAVEDSLYGMQAALAAGMQVLLVAAEPGPDAPTLPPGVLGRFPTTLEALRWLRGG